MNVRFLYNSALDTANALGIGALTPDCPFEAYPHCENIVEPWRRIELSVV